MTQLKLSSRELLGGMLGECFQNLNHRNNYITILGGSSNPLPEFQAPVNLIPLSNITYEIINNN